LSFGGDILCQALFPPTSSARSLSHSNGDRERQENLTIDFFRTAKFAFLGTVLTVPALHYWYGFLTRIISGVQFSSTMKRLFLDQIFFAPFFLTSFFSSALLLDGNAESIPTKLQNDLIGTLKANYIVWVPCQFINFMMVPPHLQVLFANSVGFFWNIYLSYSTYKTTATIDDKDSASKDK